MTKTAIELLLVPLCYLFPIIPNIIILYYYSIIILYYSVIISIYFLWYTIEEENRQTIRPQLHKTVGGESQEIGACAK